MQRISTPFGGKSWCNWLLTVLMIGLASLPSLAQQAPPAETATLKGRITDAKTKEELIGATVIIVGTYKGTAANLEGEYSLTGIKPGDYSIKFSMVGYAEKVFTGIKLGKGEVKTLNVTLNDATQTTTTIEVVGKKAVVDLESGSSSVNIGAADIKEMNVRNVQDVVAMQAGVSQSPDGLQIRGGRVYETQFVVEGINATDPLAGTGFGTEVSAGSVGEVSVVTGGSDAEFNGTSGIITAKIKEGGDRTVVYGSWQRDNFGFNELTGTAWNTDIAELNMSGTMPGTNKKLRYFVGGNLNLSDTYFRLRANQLNSSIVDNTNIGGTVLNWAPRQDNKWTNTIKLNYDISSKVKLSITNQHSLAINQNTRTLQIIGFDQIMVPGLQWGFANQMDNGATYTHRSNLTALNLKYLMSKNWTLDVTGGRLFTNLRADANGRPWRDASADRLYNPNSIVTDPVNTYNPTPRAGDSLQFVYPANGLFNNGGIAGLWHDHYVQEITARYKFSYFSNDRRHFITFGQEHKEQELLWIDISQPWVGAPIRLPNGTLTQSQRIGSSNDVWFVKPATGNFFFQDEIRYKGIIATLGGRLEYWAPGSFADNSVEDPNAPVVQAIRDDYRNQTFKFLDGRRYKARLLPKLRVSFPVTDNNVLYFNYGHAMRLPHPRFVYAGLDPNYQNANVLPDLGNPNLNPEVSVSYEFGIKSQITNDFGITFTAFYKDYFDFIVNQTITVRGPDGRFTEKLFSINQDYARVRGAEVMFNYRFSNYLRGMANASFQVATGKSNTAAESRLQIVRRGGADLSREQYLAWDRPFDFKGTLIFTPDSSFGKYLNGFRVFVSTTAKSGLRYTPTRFVGVDTLLNNRPLYEVDETKPFENVGAWWFWTDLKITRDFRIGRHNVLSFSVEINNLFNQLNSQLINPVTGAAYRYGDNVLRDSRDPRYPRPDDSGTPLDNPARYLAPRQIVYGVAFTF